MSVPPLLRELVLTAVEQVGLDRRVLRERLVLDLLLDRVAAMPADPLQLPQVRDPRAQRIAARVLAHPEEQVSLEVLAKGAGGSKRTVERAFVLDTGMTFGRWRRHARLLEALRLLAAGEPVTGVAFEVGYESVSAFVSAFRRVFGVTPGRYYAAPP